MAPLSLGLNSTAPWEPPPPVASWYTEGVSDGVGDRLLMFDNSSTPSLELLRFRRDLASAPGFEAALRNRVSQLASFSHPAYSRVRAIEHLDGTSLALVSTFAAGKRLSEFFRFSRTRRGVHPAFGAWLLHHVTRAIAALQRQAPDSVHGAITPERIVLTPEGNIVVTEHVLGTALASLALTPTEFSLRFGLLALGDSSGARIDARGDVAQIGWVVLSVLIGRRLSPAEPAEQLRTLLDAFAAENQRRAPALVPPLRRWLARALQIDPEPFSSAAEAEAALSDLGGFDGPHAVLRPETEFAGAVPALPAASVTMAARDRTFPADVHDDQCAESADPQEIESNGMAAISPFEAVPPEHAGRFEIAPAAPVASPPRRRWVGWVAAVLAVAAVGEAALLVRLVSERWPMTLPAVPVVVDSAEPGEAVFVDGREAGVTPLPLTVTSRVRSIRVRTRAVSPIAADPAPAAPAPSAQEAATLPAARERRGGLRLSTPIEIQVVEGDRVLGSSADGPIVTTAGRHEIEFVNAMYGYRSRQAVEIKAGQIVKMTVTPPDGRVSINAVPWAQVSIDGNAVGETPLANLPLSIGEHLVTFRHPQFGVQAQTVVVKADALTRVSASFRR